MKRCAFLCFTCGFEVFAHVLALVVGVPTILGHFAGSSAKGFYIDIFAICFKQIEVIWRYFLPSPDLLQFVGDAVFGGHVLHFDGVFGVDALDEEFAQVFAIDNGQEASRDQLEAVFRRFAAEDSEVNVQHQPILDGHVEAAVGQLVTSDMDTPNVFGAGQLLALRHPCVLAKPFTRS
jgi:hypothetical protein